ncbi:ZIP zinc transporter domain-containing protein [Ditylenchus destructor]|nr:ZIP zinc transporter domain-containing protein [Ditylenchus destructor]
MDKVTLQLLLAVAMFITTALAGLIPIKLLHHLHKKRKESESESRTAAWVLTLLSCFAGGVFMGTCFLDIFPHVNAKYASFREKAEWAAAYPFPEFFVCCGFFLVYFLEEMCLKMFAKTGDGSGGHGHSHGIPQSQPCEPLKTNIPGVDHPLKTHIGNGRDSRSSSNYEEGPAPLSDKENNQTKGRANSNNSNSSAEKYMAFRIVVDDAVRYIGSDAAEKGGLFKSLTFAAAMSFHSVLEGLALGVQDDTAGILTLFISLIIHKGIEAFSVGLQLSKTNTKRTRLVILTMIMYGLMTPIGSILGLCITNLTIDELYKDAIVIVLEGLAGGTFIYVTFFEVLAQERANDHSNLVQLNAIVVGFLVIAGHMVDMATDDVESAMAESGFCL